MAESIEDLWKAYPLDDATPTPTQAPTQAPTPVASLAPTQPAVDVGSDGGMLDANSDAAVFVLLLVTAIALFGWLEGYKPRSAISLAIKLMGVGFIVFMVFTLLVRGF